MRNERLRRHLAGFGVGVSGAFGLQAFMGVGVLAILLRGTEAVLQAHTLVLGLVAAGLGLTASYSLMFAPRLARLLYPLVAGLSLTVVGVLPDAAIFAACYIVLAIVSFKLPLLAGESSESG